MARSHRVITRLLARVCSMPASPQTCCTPPDKETPPDTSLHVNSRDCNHWANQECKHYMGLGLLFFLVFFFFFFLLLPLSKRELCSAQREPQALTGQAHSHVLWAPPLGVWLLFSKAEPTAAALQGKMLCTCIEKKSPTTWLLASSVWSFPSISAERRKPVLASDSGCWREIKFSWHGLTNTWKHAVHIPRI